MRSTKFLARALVPAALIGCLAGCLVGCNESRLVPKHANILPIADARIIGSGGKPIDLTVDGGADMLKIELTGNEVEVTLDGSGSKDDDGSIVAYRWLSGTEVPADGGIGNLSHDEKLADGGNKFVNSGGRLVPEGEKPDWPADVKKPKVTLSEGIWSFTLWVTDDKGAISKPDTIKITVGSAVDPAVAECAANVLASVPEACRICICSKGEKCQADVAESKCDAGCWGLISCIGAMCPDFAAMVAATPPDYSCLMAGGACVSFVGGAGGAMAAGVCITQCTAECAAMPM